MDLGKGMLLQLEMICGLTASCCFQIKFFCEIWLAVKVSEAIKPQMFCSATRTTSLACYKVQLCSSTLNKVSLSVASTASTTPSPGVRKIACAHCKLQNGAPASNLQVNL